MIYRAVEDLHFRISERVTPWHTVDLPRGTILLHLLSFPARQNFLIPTGQIAYAEGWSLESMLRIGLIKVVQE